jgi:Secretion system C-terminal sorting domain
MSIKLKQFLFVGLILSIASFAKAQLASNPLNQTPGEDDWSLPSWVTKKNNAGLYYAYTVPDAYSLLVRWKDLNPAENVYDWSIIDTAISLNVPFFIRIWASDTLHCPKWLRVKHPNIPILHNQGGTNTNSYFDLFGISPSDFFAIWDPGFDMEFKKFLLAFKAKNYLANPNIKFMYAPGAWRYNEWNLGEAVDEIVLKTPTITPTYLINWFKSHLDDYVDASNGYPYKLLYTGYGKVENPALYGSNANWFFAANDTLNGDNVLTSYAVSIGMGVREGAQENFNSSSDMYPWGSPSITINNINYQTVNDNHPLHNDSLKILGTENEAFCDPNALIGGGACSYYHIKMSTIKAMQLRINWLNVRDSLITYDPTMFQYFRLTANKTAKTSPDAWASLRQAYDPLFSAIPPAPILNSPRWVHRVTLPYRNWEKWLTQREVLPDGKSVPTYQLNSNSLFDFYNFKAFEALRTDRINGSNYIYFNVDSSFIRGGINNVQIKVTYLDNFAGNWWIEYDAAGSQVYQATTPIINSNNNGWKTVTFNINNAGFMDRQNGNMDFRIYNGGNSDISVRFVRVIKNNNPALSINEGKINSIENDIAIYPNPTNSILNIESEIEFSEIMITDLLGKLIIEKKGAFTSIDVKNLVNGVYFVSLKAKNGQQLNSKFIKQ